MVNKTKNSVVSTEVKLLDTLFIFLLFSLSTIFSLSFSFFSYQNVYVNICVYSTHNKCKEEKKKSRIELKKKERKKKKRKRSAFVAANTSTFIAMVVTVVVAFVVIVSRWGYKPIYPKREEKERKKERERIVLSLLDAMHLVHYAFSRPHKNANADLMYSMLIRLLLMINSLISRDIIVWSSNRLIISTSWERDNDKNKARTNEWTTERMNQDRIKMKETDRKRDYISIYAYIDIV